MIDDLKFIHERDAQDALGIAAKQYTQLALEYPVPKIDMVKLDNIVFTGMGGSALSALIAKSWPTFNLSFEIVRDYHIPEYVGSNTLFFASSYSGNTEETVSAIKEAEAKKACIVVITSGGQLTDIAKQKGYPLLTLPSGLQPRHAVLYSLKALLTVTDSLHISDNKAGELASKADFLKQAIQEWLPTVPTKDNQAKQIALECIGRSVVIYGGPLMYPAAYKWKISFNENAKQISWCNQYSEFNHNEFIGWSKQPVDKPYTVVDLRSNLEHPKIQKRFEVSAKLLSGLRPSPIVVEPKGSSAIEQLLWVIALGDFVSLYTALLNNINPTPVDLIEKLKVELK